MRVISVDSAQDQGYRRQHFGQRRVFLIQTQIELLQITYAGSDVGHFIDGDGLSQSSAAGQYGHEQQQEQTSHDGIESASRIFHRSLPVLYLWKARFCIPLISEAA